MENIVEKVFQAWQKKDYSLASILIKKANTAEIEQLAYKINFDMLDEEAFVHVLKQLPLKKWKEHELLESTKYEQVIYKQLAQKYKKEFDMADVNNKIKMFKDVSQNGRVPNKEELSFLRKNWQHLVHLIKQVETGIKVCDALKMPGEDYLWSTIAAIKTIEIVVAEKTVEEIEEIFPDLAKKLMPGQTSLFKAILAEKILKKIN